MIRPLIKNAAFLEFDGNVISLECSKELKDGESSCMHCKKLCGTLELIVEWKNCFDKTAFETMLMDSKNSPQKNDLLPRQSERQLQLLIEALETKSNCKFYELWSSVIGSRGWFDYIGKVDPNVKQNILSQLEEQKERLDKVKTLFSKDYSEYSFKDWEDMRRMLEIEAQHCSRSTLEDFQAIVNAYIDNRYGITMMDNGRGAVMKNIDVFHSDYIKSQIKIYESQISKLVVTIL